MNLLTLVKLGRLYYYTFCMKRITLLLPLLFFITFPQLQYAQSAGTQSAAISPTPITVDYTMPYPGLLPDNPLYVLKVFRDKLISFFISDPLKRSSFDVLQADKRLQGAYYLQKKGNSYDELVGSTVSKAENYFNSAVGEAKQAKSMGEDDTAQVGTLHTALLKHKQIITQMEQGASPQLRQNLQHDFIRLGNLESMLNVLSKQ